MIKKLSLVILLSLLFCFTSRAIAVVLDEDTQIPVKFLEDVNPKITAPNVIVKAEVAQDVYTPNGILLIKSKTPVKAFVSVIHRGYKFKFPDLAETQITFVGTKAVDGTYVDLYGVFYDYARDNDQSWTRFTTNEEGYVHSGEVGVAYVKKPIEVNTKQVLNEFSN